VSIVIRCSAATVTRLGHRWSRGADLPVNGHVDLLADAAAGSRRNTIFDIGVPLRVLAMTVTLVLREPTPDAEALVSGKRIGSALAPHGTFVGRTHPADCDGLRLQFSPTSHRRSTGRPFRVKHVRVDVDLAALNLPHPTQGIANGRHGSTRKVRLPTIVSFRRHFAYTASTSPVIITEIATLALRSG
jgi:hypothetical protein